MLRFKPPNLEEVNAEIAEKGYCVDGRTFINFYGSKGWMVGKNKMKNWKMALAGWETRDKVKREFRKTKLFPIRGKVCSYKGKEDKYHCGMPAVYRDPFGSYDTYYCPKHMPEEVRELYE